MTWFFQLAIEKITYTLKAERIFINKQIEQIKITGEGVSIVLEGNRPFIEDLQLDKEIKWKLIKGKLNNADILNQLIQALEHSLKDNTLK